MADGRRQAGSAMARSRVRACLNWVSQGQRCGRCRVRRCADGKEGSTGVTIGVIGLGSGSFPD